MATYEDVATDVAVQSCREGGCLCTQLVADAVAHGLDFDLRCVIGNSMTIEEEAAACEARRNSHFFQWKKLLLFK